VIFKPQGEAFSQTSSMAFTEDTCLLGIQTEYQCNAMRYHGAKVVCMDSTHGTNVYDFSLLSIIVVDSYGK